MAIPCMYCGNTGTVNAAPCPVCRPGGAGRDTWTRLVLAVQALALVVRMEVAALVAAGGAR